MMMLSTAGLDDNMEKIKDIDNYLNLNESHFWFLAGRSYSSYLDRSLSYF
jgi:hypothetical protein